MSCDRYHQITFITSFFASDRYVARSKTIIVRSKVAISCICHISYECVQIGSNGARDRERQRQRDKSERDARTRISSEAYITCIVIRQGGRDKYVR
jgi:hypothetical protein